MPMVHPCGWQGCAVLTMGEFCVDHEHQRETATALRRSVQRVVAASAVVAVAAAGAAIRLRVR